MTKKAVFLDRDGTINEDPGYLNHPDQLRLLPTVGEALRKLKERGFLLIVVSNQSGVGRGIIQATMIPEIHRRLNDLLKPFGVQIDDFFLCLHRPNEGCECRKPGTKLFTEAFSKRSIDPLCSFMVGDKKSDLEAGRKAGCRASILVRTGDGALTASTMQPEEANFIAGSLLEAADWILDQESAGF